MHSIRELAKLTEQAADSEDSALHDSWLKAVQVADTTSLIAATSLLTSKAEYRPARIKALREAIISEVERKNTERLIETLEKLDSAASRLGHLSLVLAVVGAVLAAVPLLQAFGYLPK